MFHREKTFWLSTIAFPWRNRATCDCDSSPPLRLRPSVLNLNTGLSGHWVHGKEVATFLMRSSPRLCLPALWMSHKIKKDWSGFFRTRFPPPNIRTYEGKKKFNVKIMLKYSFQFKLRHRLFYKTNTIQKSLPCVLNSQSSDGAGSHSFYRFFQKLSNLVRHSWHHFQSHKLKPRTRWFIKHPQQIWLHDEQLRRFSSHSPHQHCSCRWGGLWWVSGNLGLLATGGSLDSEGGCL